MSKLDVQIVTLPPMRVMCFNGFGASPEGQAFDKLRDWLKAKGLWEDGKPRRFFGYNNPDPAPGSPNYGYDIWVTVDETATAEMGGRIIDFPGGLYAVTRVDAGPQGEGIYDTWQELAAWVEHSKYTMEVHTRQWLEESPQPFAGSPSGFTLYLYEPIRE